MSLPPNRFATCFRCVLWVFRKSNKIKSANTGPALVDFALHHKVLAVLEQGVRHYWTHSVQSESLTLAMVKEIKTDVPGGKIEELKAIDVDALKDACPVFSDGCPFIKISEEGAVKEAQKCPQFKDGCPFKDAKSMADMYFKLKEIPAFAEGAHGNVLLEILKNIHDVSRDLKEEMGDCPVFDDGCPFKTVCSDGKPLVEKLELRRWTQILQGSVDEVHISVNREVAEKSHGVELSKELKKGTKKVHREAENVHFVKNFIKGKVDRELYKMLLAVLYHVYRVLEEESEKHKDHPVFSAIHFPQELNRLEFLERDLEYYFGEDWKEKAVLSEAAKKYVDRIREISKEDPTLLIAHHYTRYLGDLSGGQVLKKMARKGMQLPDSGEGVHFYDFDLIEDARKFKNMYRARLDGLNMGKEVADKVVEEANYAFLLNVWVFQEIDRAGGYEVVPPKVQKEDLEELGPKQGVDACPFAKMVKPKPAKQEDIPQSTALSQSTATKQVQCPVHNPVIWAMVFAAIAVGVGLLITKIYI